MNTTELFEQLDFQENPLFEEVIANLVAQQYSIVDGFFNQSEVNTLRKRLLELYDQEQFKKSAIGNKTNELIEKEIRGDFILWIDEAQASHQAEQVFFNKINNLVHYLNKTCFLGILHKEFHFAVYPKGTYYQRHLDTFMNDQRRKLSVVCYLNDSNWKSENGGELIIYTPNGEVSVVPKPGRLVVFESQVLEHEVKKVTHDKRLSITGWLKTR